MLRSCVVVSSLLHFCGARGEPQITRLGGNRLNRPSSSLAIFVFLQELAPHHHPLPRVSSLVEGTTMPLHSHGTPVLPAGGVPPLSSCTGHQLHFSILVQTSRMATLIPFTK